MSPGPAVADDSSPHASAAPRQDFRVRLATVSDAPSLAATYAPHCTEGLASFETEAPSVDEMAERVRRTITTYPWLVAVDGVRGAVAGYACGSEHRERAGYRWSVDVAVYVAPSAAGRGVGRTLYGRLLPLLAAQGFHRAHAGIALPNDASVALHRAAGFEPVGVYREVGYKRGAWLDVQWWSLALAPSAVPPADPIPLAGLSPEMLADPR